MLCCYAAMLLRLLLSAPSHLELELLLLYQLIQLDDKAHYRRGEDEAWCEALAQVTTTRRRSQWLREAGIRGLEVAKRALPARCLR